MSEQSSSAKLRRRVISFLRLILPASSLEKIATTPAEQAAIALARATKAPMTQHPVTTFAIPLVGAHQVSDWSVIEKTLARCLTSLIGQTNTHWRAVICSQTRPDVVDLDPRISYLPFTQKVDGHDKVAKLDCLSDMLLGEDAVPGYFMPLDGDDLLHKAFVEHLHRIGSHGLLVSEGAMLNAATGDLCRTAKRSLKHPLQKPFWKFCGSCMALPVGRASKHERLFFKALARHEHRLYPYLAKLAGIPLRKSTDPLALYIINHGENFETRRGRGGFKQRFARKFALDPDQSAALIQTGFPEAGDLIRPNTDDL